MVINYKCPGCGATMEYDPQDGKMHCAFCKSSYEPDRIERRAYSDDPPKIVAAERETARKQARIVLRERHSDVKEFYRRNLHVNEPDLDGALERFMQERRQKRG